MVLGNSEEYHRVLQKILCQKGHRGPSIGIHFLQCLYSVKLVVKIDFKNTELCSYHIMHHSISNMFCIAFRAIEHTWSALTVSPNKGRLTGAKPALVFALATHHSPFLKFFPAGIVTRRWCTSPCHGHFATCSLTTTRKYLFSMSCCAISFQAVNVSTLDKPQKYTPAFWTLTTVTARRKQKTWLGQ